MQLARAPFDSPSILLKLLMVPGRKTYLDSQSMMAPGTGRAVQPVAGEPAPQSSFLP